MTGVIQRHRALIKFLLVHGREIRVPIKQYWDVLKEDTHYNICLRENLLSISVSRDDATSIQMVKMRITKKGYQYMKRNPYKKARER